MRLGIIIQARLGSTRLPGKVLMEFYEKESILDIIYHKLQNAFPELELVLATSTNEQDNALAQWAGVNNVSCFRGSEDNVISRFIAVCEQHDFTHCVRICADNPFIDVDLLQQLIDAVADNDRIDYCAHRIDGTPSILTHLGIWAEIVSLRALKKVVESTNDAFYFEHVTNFIYGNPNIFDIEWIDGTRVVESSDIRLTVDTISDFKLSQVIFEKVGNSELSSIFNYVLGHEEVLGEMKSNIKMNSK